MRAGSDGRLFPLWNTPCCDRLPVRVEGAKHVCPYCGQVLYDTAQLVRDAFGPCERAIAQPRVSPVDLDDAELWSSLERWCDA